MVTKSYSLFHKLVYGIMVLGMVISALGAGNITPARAQEAGTETPSKAGSTFSPLGRAYTNVLTNQTSQNYSASLNGCAPAAGTTAIPFPAGGKTATVSFSQEPDLLSGLFSSMSYSAWVAQSILVGLATWDADNNFVPELAAVIPTTANGGISADGLTITWHLKPCLYWSDGEPLTSADVKFTWQVETDPGNAVYSRAGYDQITSIDTPDDTTVVLHFNSLYPGWQTLFTSGPNNQGNLQPMHLLHDKTGLESDPFTHWPTISSGPFIITDWVAGDHLTLLPNPNYWRGHPKLDQILIKFVPDQETAKTDLQNGTVDFVPDFAESDLADLPALEPAIHTRADPGPEFEHYLFNLGVQGTGVGQSDYAGFCPFQNVNVRKAIILGIDRQTLVDTLLFGKTTVPASLWPNSYWTNTSLTPYPYDPTQARTLLQNAGYIVGTGGIRHGMCNGVDTKLSFNFETTTKQLRVDMALAVQGMLANIGVEFKPIHTPSGTFFGNYASGANMATGNFDMAGYTTGFYPDPYTDNFLCSTVISNQNQGGDNNYHLCDPALDTLFQQANASADPAVRKTVFDQIQQYMYDDALVIPIYARLNVMAYTDRFILPPTSMEGGMMGDTYDWDVKMITISGNAGVSGATLSYTDGTAKTASANGTGAYSFLVSYNWSGTVTPSRAGYKFFPASRTYNNIKVNQTGQNFAAIRIRDDYDGDGKTDPAKFIASAGSVWWLKSSTGLWDGKWLGPDTFTYVRASDFDGDGKTDPAKFYPATGTVWWVKSSTHTLDGAWLGPGTFTYVAGCDFDGDGKTDPTKYVASTHILSWLKSSTGLWSSVDLGTGTYTLALGQ